MKQQASEILDHPIMTTEKIVLIKNDFKKFQINSVVIYRGGGNIAESILPKIFGRRESPKSVKLGTSPNAIK
jgi:hypothetical protein